uniref:Type VI secretion system baseplate subunit TssF n=1 Tax=Macrostomum lignano TaxID=282301 RepID=A0A1I8IQ95_9PLAT
MGTLVSLSRPAQKSGGRGRHAVAFFASLYAVFARHHASVLGDDIRQMLISMINANLAFCRASVGLSGQRHSGLSRLGFALSELCDWVAINSAENAADRQSLGRYMTILNRAAMYSRIPPQPIVDCLAQLASINSDQYNSPPATSIEDSNLWLCGHRILDVSRSVFRTHWHRLQTDAGLLANLCGVLAHWAGPGDFDLYVDIDKLASIVFESSTAVGVDSAAQKNFVITDQSGAMSHRTRTSLAVAAPTASQAMPEMRLLAEPPVELNLLTEQSGLDCELTNSDAETVLIVPVRLTCRRTSELLNESDLLAVDLTFSTHPDTADLSDSTPAGLEAASEDDLAGEASRIATVDSVHLPRLRLPTPSDQSASESLVEVNIGLRVACHRPLPFRLAIRLDCTSGIECRPLTAQLSSIRLGLADLLRPLLRT